MLTLANNSSYTDNPTSFSMMAVFGGLYYSGTSELERPAKFISLKDGELTQLCMEVSEKSLAKVWANEDDAEWESYLKD